MPDKVQEDKKSLKIGMVTCFADTTLESTVKDENRRLENTRSHGQELLYPKDAAKALKEEIAAASKAIGEICEKQGGTILQIQITGADNIGRKALNKIYPSVGYFKVAKTITCPVPSCADRGGIQK